MDKLMLLHVGLAIAGMFSIVCRLQGMSRDTLPTVRWQHALLFAGLLWSIVVPREFAALPVLGGVVAALLLGAERWKDGPPAGTSRPRELDLEALRHVSGGKG